MTIDISKLSPKERAFVAEHERLHKEFDNPLHKQVAGTHYKQFAIQPVEFITRNNLSFLEGCVVKRICRWRNKNGIEDLLKARHEIDLLIALERDAKQGEPWPLKKSD